MLLKSRLNFVLDYPSDRDPAKFDANVRKEICREIFDSRWFRAPGGRLLDPDEVYQNREDPRYARTFRKLYSLGEYTNNYDRQSLPFYTYRARDYAFLCPVDYESTGYGIELYAVTKEYNVSPDPNGYKAGRFIVPRKMRFVGLTFRPILAEEPARVKIRSEVEVERHYRRTRAHVGPGSDLWID